jgi:hypothetical protein
MPILVSQNYSTKQMRNPLLYIILSLLPFSVLFAQSPAKDSISDVGVAVSPAHLNFNLKPGESGKQEIKITNETKMRRTFKVTIKDFDMNNIGKASFMNAGTSAHSISQWMSISPSLIELAPGAIGKVTVTINIPDSDGTNRAAWCIAMIEEVKARQQLEPEGNKQKISLGVIPSFGFGVYIYQNPPDVATNKVEIRNFIYNNLQDSVHKRNLDLTLTNTGDGIAFCTAYVELTNTKTGQQQRLMVKRFTILPGYTRNYIYILPESLAKGHYSAVGVLDYGSKDIVEAAELEFRVD